MRYIILPFLLLLNMHCFSQGIYAGLSTNSDYHFSFNSPFELVQADTNSTNMIELDLNNDGLKDIRISSTYYESYQWGQEKKIVLQSLNNTEIAITQNDSCYSIAIEQPTQYAFHIQPIHELSYYDLIDSNLNWIDTIATLSYDTWDVNYYPISAPISCNYESSLLIDTGYIAVRLLVEMDTVYSWLQLSMVDVNSCFIHGFASTQQELKLLNSKKENSLIIFPNPADTQMQISSEEQIQSIELKNYLGQTVKHFHIASDYASLNIQEYPPGFYILNIKRVDGGVTKRNFIIN